MDRADIIDERIVSFHSLNALKKVGRTRREEFKAVEKEKLRYFRNHKVAVHKTEESTHNQRVCMAPNDKLARVILFCFIDLSNAANILDISG